MASSGSLARHLTRFVKGASGLFQRRNMPVITRNASTTTREYDEQCMEKIRKNYFLANRDVFDRMNMAEFNYFISITTGRRWDDLDVRQLFFEMDANKDEYISLPEILMHLNKALKEPTRGEMAYAFCRFDKDFDDYMYLHELREALFFLGFFQAGDRRIKDFFMSRDKDRDNRIKYDEFVKIVKKDMASLFG